MNRLILVAVAAMTLSQQSARGQTAATAAETPSGGEAIQDIVVTAQKNGAQRLLDTQISVTAFTGEHLDRSSYTQLSDAIASTPGLSVTSQGLAGQAQYQIRGASSLAGDASVGIYFDDTPFSLLTVTYVPDVDPFDLQRVEVLRGPQGTLYGASSEGGTVRILTKDASTTKYEVKAAVQVGDQDGSGVEYKTNLAVNVPVIDNVLGVRLTGGATQEPGYLTDRVGNRNFNDENDYYIRPKVTFTPLDRLEIRAFAWVRRTDAHENFGDANYVAPQPGPLLYPALPASLLVTGPQSKANTLLDIYNGAVDWDLQPMRLYSSTSVLHYALVERDGIFSDDSTIRADTVVNETRLSSNYDSILQWNAGTFYDVIRQQQFIHAAFLGLPANYEKRGSDQFAAFGEGHLKPFGEAVEFTGGVRWFNDDRFFESPILFLTGVGNIPTPRKEKTFDKITWRGNMAYRWDDQLAYINVSTGFRSGGFNFASTLALAPPGSVPASYRPEDVTAYEIGGKFQLFDKQLVLELAGYYNHYRNLIFDGISSAGFASVQNGGPGRAFGFEWGVTWLPIPDLTLATSGNLNNSRYTSSNPLTGITDGDRIQYVPAAQVSASASYRHPVTDEITGFANLDFTYSSRRFDHAPLASVGPSGVVFTQLMDASDPLTLLTIRAGLDFGQYTVFVYGNNLLNERGRISTATISDADVTPLSADPHVRPTVVGLGATMQF